MFIRKYWLPVSVFILTIAGIGLYLLATQPPKDPVVIYKSVEPIEKPTMQAPVGDTSEGGHFHADGTWHGEPHDPPAAPAVLNRSTFAPIAVADGVNPTSTSSNPMFADGVPEHLQCPPEFIDVYGREDKENIIRKTMPIYDEILEKWNPNRPIANLWDAYIEHEKWYRENADPERAEFFGAAGRVDWLVQQWLDYPEIVALLAEDKPRASDMLRVEIGMFSPDWNAFTLPDDSGRTFRTDVDKKYVFTWGPYTETSEDETRTTTRGPWTLTEGPMNGDPNAEVIEIDLDTISDAELEHLQGWNYNINPYTTGAYKLGENR